MQIVVTLIPSTELYISGSSGLPSSRTVIFSAGASIMESSRAFGFQMGDYQPLSAPWVVFVNKLPACLWGPLTRRMKTIFLNKYK